MDQAHKVQYEPLGGTRFGATLTKTPVTLGAFHHLVGIYNGAAILGYLDGVRDDDGVVSEGTTPDVGDALVVGCRPIDATYDFCLDDWSIDELAIYDYALTPTEVAAHYRIVRP